MGDVSKVDFSETRKEYERRTNTGPLPYLKVNLNVLKKEKANAGSGSSRIPTPAVEITASWKTE